MVKRGFRLEIAISRESIDVLCVNADAADPPSRHRSGNGCHPLLRIRLPASAAESVTLTFVRHGESQSDDTKTTDVTGEADNDLSSGDSDTTAAADAADDGTQQAAE